MLNTGAWQCRGYWYRLGDVLVDHSHSTLSNVHIHICSFRLVMSTDSSDHLLGQMLVPFGLQIYIYIYYIYIHIYIHLQLTMFIYINNHRQCIYSGRGFKLNIWTYDIALAVYHYLRIHFRSNHTELIKMLVNIQWQVCLLYLLTNEVPNNHPGWSSNSS